MRVRLVPLSAADLADLASGKRTHRGMKIADGALPPSEVLRMMRDVVAIHSGSDAQAWLIADDDTAAGMISFTRFVSNGGAISQDDRHDFGYVVAPSFRDRGVATKAIAALIKMGRSRGYATLTAETDPENRASERVLEKNGFRRISEASLVRWALSLH